MAADQITLDRIEKMHPKLRAQLKEQYLHVNNNILGKGVRLRFSHTLRTIEEQNALYALGRTVKGKKVTNAKGGQSYHNFGLAFDVVLLYDKDGNGTFETASWDLKADFDNDKHPDFMEVVNYFVSQGWTWGGTFSNFDAPHFQKTFGYSTAQLKLKMNGNYPTI